MTENTTELSYWLNWRFLLCALIVLFSISLAVLLIWRYEGGKRRRRSSNVGVLHDDDAWKTCLKCINPVWLLCFRVCSFIVLLSLIVGNTIKDTDAIFIYYTQCTFSLVTIYFGIASALSIHGIWQHKFGSSTNRDQEYEDLPMIEENLDDNQEARYLHQTAGFWRYLLQIIYQTAAAAVVLTDAVFWLVIFPLLTQADYNMDCYMYIMHTVNVVLIGDTLMNCMNFPLFRFGYFMLWSALYIIFQWIIHACIYFWWPYAFLDLASSYAPLWYLGLAVLHVPCYGLFALIIKLKQWWMSRYFAESYML